RLLDYLGNLPLAITLASAFISTTQVSITEYLGLVTNNSILAVWKLSFEQISRDKPLAADYLRFMCFLSDSAIPISLLPSTHDEIETHEAIDTLKAYSFITGRENAGSVDMQRLVRSATLAWLAKEGKHGQYATLVMRRLAEVLSFLKHEHSKMWLEYLPHVQTALESRSNCTDKKAECQLPSMNNFANILERQGKYEEAEHMRRQQVERVEKTLGYKHPSTLASMHNLALVLHLRGMDEEAEEISRQVFQLKLEVLGLEHPDTFATLDSLALILDSLGCYEESEQKYQQTLELRQRLLGYGHPDTLGSMHNLARLVDRRVKTKETGQILHRALESSRMVLGFEHPDNGEPCPRSRDSG
ncbi:hypothetical protein BR93DRAFT_885409, partial [Coniochaeta sp. PMI_546]